MVAMRLSTCLSRANPYIYVRGGFAITERGEAWTALFSGVFSHSQVSPPTRVPRAFRGCKLQAKTHEFLREGGRVRKG